MLLFTLTLMFHTQARPLELGLLAPRSHNPKLPALFLYSVALVLSFFFVGRGLLFWGLPSPKVLPQREGDEVLSPLLGLFI
jgi:hypothetical protein